MLPVLLVVLAGLSACSKHNPDDKKGDLDRQPMLINYADNYILPAYDTLKGSLKDLKTNTDAFVAAPNATTLQQLRTAWKAAYFTWQKVDLLEFGPAEEVSLRTYMNIFPATESKIEANISSGTYNLETFGNKDAQGFPALDYLLNGLATTDAALLEKFTTDDVANARKQYLQDIVTKMLTKVEMVNESWQSHRNTFIEKTSTDVNGSISKMVNAYVLYYERYLRSGKIGYPVGAMTGTPLPTHIESFYSPDLSKDLALTALESVIRFYEGGSFDGQSEGKGMKSYLLALGTEDNGQPMAEIISEELAIAHNSLSSLHIDLKDAVVNNRPMVLDIYDDLQLVVASLKVDMVSAFGISISYTDNDGD